MKPAPAKVPNDSSALEDLGRATLQIVHDLKNQLNGLKLYATYLRKRLEREDRTTEERETLTKLISGLDRAAKDMTALVRYAQPLELRRQQIDLRKIVSDVVAEIGSRETGGLPRVMIATHIDATELLGAFDPIALTQAIKAITDDVRITVSPKAPGTFSLDVRREANSRSVEALVEWRGGKLAGRHNPFRSSITCGTVHTALGAKIIEAHGGRLACDGDVIRAWLPLINEANS